MPRTWTSCPARYDGRSVSRSCGLPSGAGGPGDTQVGGGPVVKHNATQAYATARGAQVVSATKAALDGAEQTARTAQERHRLAQQLHSRGETDRVEQLIKDSHKHIKAALYVGETAERLALLGSHYKKLATIRAVAERQKLTEEAMLAYSRARKARDDTDRPQIIVDADYTGTAYLREGGDGGGRGTGLLNMRRFEQRATETLVIDKDATGRLWATWVQDGTVLVTSPPETPAPTAMPTRIATSGVIGCTLALPRIPSVPK